MPEKVVLAYSGGLDTSIIIPWLKENYGCDVIAFVGDVGQGDDLEAVVEKAYKTGASDVVVEDLRDEFLTGYVFPALRAGAVYEHKYLLGTSLARPVIAKHQAEVARRFGATTVAHGCTGKGNDQVRFELAYQALAPELKVIAPWREWELHSREDCLDYAEQRGIPVAASRAKIHSRDRNLWHLSHEGGELEDPNNPPLASTWMLTRSPQEAADREEEVTIGFEQGTPVSVNGVQLDPVSLVELLNEIGGRNAIGRVDLVENRFVGIKSRGCYETPGGTLLVTAHRELEALCLDREVMHFKEQIGIKYAELVYYGLWFTPLREALDAFVNRTQTEITGSVSLSLYKGNVAITGRQSEYSLYNTDLAAFTMGDGYDQKDAAGFIRILGLPARSRARASTSQQTSIGFPPQAAVVRQDLTDREPSSGFVGDTGFAENSAEVTQ
ncbi:MAG TPA: argininosuccinate synthase [Terriglobales bacterium]|jgi:argininosuccinate synthase|nr:argininosuccinate synthase [Terriglobales bacterium]